MANRRNSVKKIRTDKRREVVNTNFKSEIRTITRKFQTACSEKNSQQAGELYRELFSKLDKAVKRGTLKENTVNRTKSRSAARLSLVKS